MSHQLLSLLTLVLAGSCANVPASEQSLSGSSELFDLLDSDGDGALSPFEALDELLVISDEGPLTRESLNGFMAQRARDELDEDREFFAAVDPDRDGLVSLDELQGDLASMVSGLDEDGDGLLCWGEYRAGNLNASELLARGEGAGFYAELVREVGEPVRVEAASPDLAEELRDLDLDRDGVVTASEVVEVIRLELSGATFEVSGDTAVMRGVISTQTPSCVLELVFVNPGVRTIVLQDVPGSIDDVANLRAGRYIRQLGLSTHVPADGMVASGGTDLFLAGAQRSAEPGALFGIHSWSGGPVEATELPRDHEDHRLYLDYYREMGIPADFYWRTLFAAPPEGNHWMTEEELARFGFFVGAGAH